MRVAVRVERARRVLVGTLLITSVAKAVAFSALFLLIAGVIDLAAALPLSVRGAMLPAAVLGGLATLSLMLARGRHAFQRTRVALYLEERTPALEYALVTALGGSGPNTELLEQAVDRAAPAGALRAPVTSAAFLAGAMLALPLIGVAALPAAVRERILHPTPGDALLVSRPAVASASRIATIAVRVTPPPYSGHPARDYEDPAAVSGLVGSRIVLRGRGAARAMDSLGASIGQEALSIAAVGDTWSVSLPMPEKPAALRLSDRHFGRLLALEPVADQPPAASLTAPSRDTTYLLPTGRLLLAGTARDDIGLTRAEFELMHTTGAGERFDIRRTTLGSVSPGGATSAAVHATLLLDTMRLGPGDVLHVRVVARDGNDLSGPGEGASDTRTIRIADPRSRDTVQVIPAAVAALDTTMLSQRMLVIRAETLLVQRKRIASKVFEDRARRLGIHQGMLRERVEAVIEELTTATEVGFTGETEVSVILEQAVAAMKLAQRELGELRVREALPYMYQALKALEKVRNSDRLYLRGVFPKLVIDLDKIRLKGMDQPNVAARDPRPALVDARKALRDRLDRALMLLARHDPSARDSLIVIRIDALTQAPDAAPALARAIDALHAGQDPAALIASARRSLLRATEATPGVPAWRAAP